MNFDIKKEKIFWFLSGQDTVIETFGAYRKTESTAL